MTAPTLFTAPPGGSRKLYGQGSDVVGTFIRVPWWPGTWEVTQGWGPTDYDGEPEGHGYNHWHAGVDVGADCGTVITLPLEHTGTARSLDNPGGYGTALVVLIDGGPGILLGHLRQRLVDDGEKLQGGRQLAVSNSTGNSSGCHVHFEVRPQDQRETLGISRYGSDVDPSGWLLYGTGDNAQLLAAQPTTDLGSSIGAFFSGIVRAGQILLGGLLVAGGLVISAYGARGGTQEGLQEAAGSTLRQLGESRPAPSRPRPQPPSEARESRVRPDLQRKVERPEPATREGAQRALREGRQLTVEEATLLGAVPRS